MWGRVRYLRCSMGIHRDGGEVYIPLIYWGAFDKVEWLGAENMNPMMVTTERVFTMAIENIAFLLTALESQFVATARED
jgi:hypothetical protein